MRTFVVIGHRAVTAPNFSLDDVPGTSGRLDVLLRSVASAFVVSHGIRRDTEAYMLLLGPPDPPRAVWIQGERLRHLNPDERTTAALFKKALALQPSGATWLQSTPGIAVSKMKLEGILEKCKGRELVLLEEAGQDLHAWKPGPNPVFVLGDDKGFTDAEIAQVRKGGATQLSLGPIAVHADQAITIAHNYLDRTGGPSPHTMSP
ncbi:MAG TPA: tRNA (pseudouridine(54)-N(1))-methyltransferase TrmY [Candidatus Thermoplasmatota archaeon]|nr:tRNA (pseudouridine(54)-N(1))-methyltransferase TrmY [Candidatus Thermoplasmatota archaeon]